MDKLWFKARRVISVLLVFAMLASLTPVQAFAVDEGTTDVPSETQVVEQEPTTVEGSEEGTNGANEEQEVPPADESTDTDTEGEETVSTENVGSEDGVGEIPNTDPIETVTPDAVETPTPEVVETPAPSEEPAQDPSNDLGEAGPAPSETPVPSETPASTATPVPSEEPVKVSYTVKYLDKATEEVVSPETTGEAAVGDIIAIDAPEVEGYTLCADQPTELVLTEGTENIAVVYYEAIAEVQEAPMQIMFSMLRADPGVTQPVTIQKGEEETFQYDLPMGNIAENAPRYDGYRYVDAVIGNNRISYLGVYEENGVQHIYYALEQSAEGVALLLQEGQTIVLRYEKIIPTYNVEYVLKGDCGNSTVNGAAEIKQDATLRFEVKPESAQYSVANVTATNGTVTKVQENLYELANVTGNTKVTVEFAKVQSYTITWNNNEIKQGSIQGNQPVQVEAGNSTTLTLVSDDPNRWDDSPWVWEHYNRSFNLDSLVVNGKGLNIPYEYVEGATATTPLPGGTQITVTLTSVVSTKVDGAWNAYGWKYYYTISISNISENINFEKGNFKDDTRYEIIVKDLPENVRLQMYDGDTLQEHGLNGVWAQGDNKTIYLNVPAGYTPTIQEKGGNGIDTSLKVTANPGTIAGFAYTHTATYVGGASNLQLFVYAEQDKYGAIFLSESEEFESYDQMYVIGDSFWMPIQIPSREGYIFEGWTIQGEESGEEYGSGQLFKLTAENIAKAKNGTFTFVAKWKENQYVQTGDPIGYQVRICKDGSQVKVVNGQGYVGNTAYYYTADVPEEIGQGYKIDESSSTRQITLTGNALENILVINYVKDETQWATVTFDKGEGQSLEGAATQEVLKGTAFEAVTKPTAKPQEDYKFKAWTLADGKEVPETVDGDITVVAAYYKDRNDNGTPDEEESITVTFNVGENGTTEDQTVYTLLKGYDSYPVAPEVVANTDYGFKGWAPEYTLSGQVPMEAEDASFTAEYFDDKNGDGIPDDTQYYNITYVAEGNGSVSSSKETAVIQGIEGVKGSVATPVDGYRLEGWYKDGVKISEENALTPDVIAKNLNSNNSVYLDTTFVARFVIRTDLTYTVRYLEDGTARELNGAKVVGGQTFGATVTESAINIPGYTMTSDKNPQSITIGTGENVITFYYKEIGPDVEPTPTETPTTPTIPTTPTTPTTPAGPTTPTLPATGGPSVTAAPEATQAPAEEEIQEEIQEEETPLAPEAGEGEEETIGEGETPLAGGNAAWALLNLILTILTALGSLILLIGYFIGRNRREEEDETTGETRTEYEVNRHGFWRLVSLIPGIGAIIVFILTEDMSLPMVFVDKWTLLMVIIAVIQIVIAVLSMRNREEPDEDDQANA